jgi:hypothetical protein
LRGMEDPANGVVDPFFFRESLMATLVSDDPKTSGHETSSEGVESPESIPRRLVKNGVREREVAGVDEFFGCNSDAVDASEEGKIHDAEKNVSGVLLKGVSSASAHT